MVMGDQGIPIMKKNKIKLWREKRSTKDRRKEGGWVEKVNENIKETSQRQKRG